MRGTSAVLLRDCLTEKGHKAVVFDNLSHSRRDLLPAGVEFIEGELADRRALEAIFEAARKQDQPFDAVLHFAALIEAGESMVRPEIYFRNNTASTLSLLEAMLACGSQAAGLFLHRGRLRRAGIRSDSRRCAPRAHQPLRPVQAPGGADAGLVQPHSRPALCLAALLQRGRRAEGPAGITRGEAHEPETHLIPLVLDVALGRRPSIRIYGDDYPTPDGTCIRDYIHVSDLADAHLLALAALDVWPRKAGPAHLQPW